MKAEEYYDRGYYRKQMRNAYFVAIIVSPWFQKRIKKEDYVLDFGAGAGHLLKKLDCKRKVAVEVSPWGLRDCKKNGIEAYRDLSFISDNTINAIVSNSTLEHIEKPVDILREFFRVLKPGGKVILITPHERWNIEFNEKNPDHHLYNWNNQHMGNCLKLAGFSRMDIRTFNYAFPPNFKNLYKLHGRDKFDQMAKDNATNLNVRQLISVAFK